ncbi:LysR family transcriptional regulator [Anaerotruncus sp. AF02-27]|jgi:DNA-binding transcriptional LysR family regulator|uniref:selenium metabolism-associated LysR family transcriptional regulator n=3 Tax=Oscillospiraceae TaxID=216572 RepID=UPI000E4E3578|nr:MULTISPECIES: selenium metabolism-associated LysR family transcriptional regulator [Anaerotruncus]RGX54755.1 LysR family transcriptional regulator [Anaerotruncus sp. AF02-27]
MEFKQLQSFIAVAKHNSFTKAAERLYISQPTISAHIRALEEELRTRLILRTTKSIELTCNGQELYDYAVNIMELRDRMIKHCSEVEKKIIHLGASTIPSAYILPEVLPVYGKDHPEVYFIIHQSDSQTVADGLLDGVFDIGLMGMKSEDRRLDCTPFCQDHMVVITPVNEHFLALKEQAQTPVEILLKEPIILREKGSGSKKSIDYFLESLGVSEEDLQITARVNDQEAIKNLVAGGLGISITSEKAAHNFLIAKRLLMFELPEYSRKRDLYLALRKNSAPKSYVLEFAQFVKRHYEQA